MQSILYYISGVITYYQTELELFTNVFTLMYEFTIIFTINKINLN